MHGCIGNDLLWRPKGDLSAKKKYKQESSFVAPWLYLCNLSENDLLIFKEFNCISALYGLLGSWVSRWGVQLTSNEAANLPFYIEGVQKKVDKRFTSYCKNN